MGEKIRNKERTASKTQNKRKVGSIWERYAGERLKSAGLQIIKYNFRCRLGEIDIVARDGDYIVFTEVKFRRSKASGNPLEAVTAYKQNTIRKVASFFLLQAGLRDDTPCRFDVFGIETDSAGKVLKEHWIKNAF